MVRVSFFSFVSTFILAQAAYAYAGNLDGPKNIGKQEHDDLITPMNDVFRSRVSVAKSSGPLSDWQVWTFEKAGKDPNCCDCDDLYFIHNEAIDSYLTISNTKVSPNLQDLIISAPRDRHAWRVQPDSSRTYVITYYDTRRPQEKKWAVQLSETSGKPKLNLGVRKNSNKDQSWEITDPEHFYYEESCGSPSLSFQ